MADGMSRRRFLAMSGLASLALAMPRDGWGSAPRGGPPMRYDGGDGSIPGGLAGEVERVIVIGAGFAGLAVANALANAGVECVVLEARDRLGGRAHTIDVGGAPVDLGCSWITDPIGNPVTRFATQSGVLQTNAAIELDVPTSRFYDDRTGIVLTPDTLRAASHYVTFYQDEGAKISEKLGRDASMKDGILYYADEHELRGNPRRRGIFFLRLVSQLSDATDWENDSLYWFTHGGSSYLGVGQGDFPVGGYRRIVTSLGGGADVHLGTAVTTIEADAAGVTVHATHGGNAAAFSGSHVVVTVPLGVLKADAIGFAPALPSSKRSAIGRMGFGTFEKVVVRFPYPYWATEHTHIFHLSDPDPMRFPAFVDYFHLEEEPILVAFNTGRHAQALDGLTDTQIADATLRVLRKVQGGPIPDPTEVVITRWGSDPYSMGSYSYIAVGSSQADQIELSRPHLGRVLFAGEATSTTRYGYADGAFTSGIREAKRLLRQPSVELRAYRGPLSDQPPARA